MTTRKEAEIYRIEWDGILIEIIYDPEWLPPHILDLAHLDIQSIYPTRAPLPITETGYLSHFIAGSVIAAAGGAVTYVQAALDAESKKPEWLNAQKARQQLTLF